MLSFPNSKINLGLTILRKRKDGFHDLETVFYPIVLKDILEIVTAANTNVAVSYSHSGFEIEGLNENNLCIKAYDLLKKDFPSIPAIKLHLHKAIPMGAGLGGGSADAAFTLQLLNEMFQLSVPVDQLMNYAATLGSDAPFFMINKPCYATGRGEVLEEIDLNLSAYRIILVNPGIHINTAQAFSQITPSLPERSIKEIIQQPVSAWKDMLKNDFEKPVFENYPAIKNIKEELYRQGALYAAMSGSGSTVFGIFETAPPVSLFLNTNYFIRIITLPRP